MTTANKVSSIKVPIVHLKRLFNLLSWICSSQTRKGWRGLILFGKVQAWLLLLARREGCGLDSSYINVWFIKCHRYYHIKPISSLRKGGMGIIHIPHASSSHWVDSQQETLWIAHLNSTQWNIREAQCPAFAQWKERDKDFSVSALSTFEPR